jgi:ssDNA-binding Zn-finger/Zn-ribbon topoisomerase 1
MSETFDRREYDGAGRFAIRSGRPSHGKPGRKRPPSPEGEGPCPKCGAPTRLIDKGAFGPFRGCTKFPDCRGTRRATAEEIQTSEDNRAFWAEHGMTDPNEDEKAEHGDAPRTQAAYGKYPYGIKHHSDSLKGAR